jgi:DNA mismatch endonuclease (patch repair protein)
MMTDVVDKATRSRMMSGIRDKNTSPEMIVRRFLHARGFRYRLHVRHLPGRPDLVFPKYQSVVMVHGCFWHQHRGCKDAVMPMSNRRFWKAKLDGNRARDKRNAAALTKNGWRWAVIWECALREGKGRKMPAVLESLARWLRAGRR